MQNISDLYIRFTGLIKIQNRRWNFMWMNISILV